MSGQPYSNNTKEKIKARDNFKCFFCGTKKNITIAHVFCWKKDNGLPVMENGIVLCRKCHDKMDFGKDCTREEQIRMLRLCEMYLTFFYMREIKDVDVKGKVKKCTK